MRNRRSIADSIQSRLISAAVGDEEEEEDNVFAADDNAAAAGVLDEEEEEVAAPGEGAGFASVAKLEEKEVESSLVRLNSAVKLSRSIASICRSKKIYKCY